MSRQGAQGGGQPRDWWAQLYDPRAPDTGRARASDSLDERYRSVSRTLTDASGAEPGPSGAVAPEPAGVLPMTDPGSVAEVVPDTVLEGTRYGRAALRAASVRGEAARRAGELRTDALLVVRFGAGEDGLLLAAVAAGAGSGPGGHRAAREVCHSVGAAVGRSSARLVADLRADRRSELQPGLHRLTDRAFGRLRAKAAALGLEPGRYTADLRCLLLPADPRCRTRVAFGTGEGGLFRLRGGAWQDIGPPATMLWPPERDSVIGRDPAAGAAAARDGFTPAQPPEPARTEPFRFRSCAADPGDVLLLCGPGLAEPLRAALSPAGQPHAEPTLADRLAARWAPPGGELPGPGAYLDELGRGGEGSDGDRTAVTIWES
ncbi:protein phosphatase 2C domain-containing protein [Streptomyces spirodelae]|uniref:Protein phosphatase 2C domain-containing protein n=1 Tax=Streptomyces spirodelae TaxID=2812904 RepID=A0ABS3WQK2_9ACTN|nr:protein phosphatase 2C domain-containing protein [Streptomyces spirodelae]MBO8185398.1 protein phosphatase 2C domain-containing protein [Streptomyces spirodelae]